MRCEINDVRLQRAIFERFEEFRQILLDVRLAHCQRQSHVEGVTDEEGVDEAGIHAWNADDTAATGGGNGLTQDLFRFEGRRTVSVVLPFASNPTASMEASTPWPAVCSRINSDGSTALKSTGMTSNVVTAKSRQYCSESTMKIRSVPSMRAHGADIRPTGPAPKMATARPVLNLRVQHGLVTRRQNVGEEQHALVRQRPWHFERAYISFGHTDKFSLPARDASVQVGVSEEGSGWRHLRSLAKARPLVRIGRFARGKQVVFAEEAPAAGDDEGDDHAVDGDVRHFRPRFLNDAHELVADIVPMLRFGNFSMVQMKVWPADGGCGDSQPHVVPREKRRVGVWTRTSLGPW
jgi:hypothetical protein